MTNIVAIVLGVNSCDWYKLNMNVIYDGINEGLIKDVRQDISERIIDIICMIYLPRAIVMM